MKEIVMELLNYIISLGYLGVALALMIEIIPSELVLAYGGFMVSVGHLNFAGVVIAGTIGGVIAQIFLYWLGYYGGRPILEKYGKYLLIHKKHLDLSEMWFDKYGVGVIFFARFVPVVRHAISIPAGISKMSLNKFTFFTILAIIPWSILFIYLGEKLGQNWDKIKDITAPYVDVIGIFIIAVFILFVLVKFRQRKFKP
ncbi:membrane protein DedA with SNARE-associated domain [Scopulibacillus daqui]|uniref:Membrane protein DedA with SNARE-associated domain n=1 Tax=Scopulibacillus daqui TaxID=1469162 RepID=A0ABS2PYX6_9BACL|nr:DedA family protein [Scopulibacillus daqui]MBM7645227.1 membrane protein DedA with SNARE-associated domain [Scopulibacillus daqui]